MGVILSEAQSAESKDRLCEALSEVEARANLLFAIASNCVILLKRLVPTPSLFEQGEREPCSHRNSEDG